MSRFWADAMFRSIIAFAMLLVVRPLPSVAETRVWTLEACIEYAYEHNIELRRQRLAYEGKEVSLSEAKWKFLPDISAGTDYSLSAGRVLDETTYDFVENEVVGGSSLYVSAGMEIFQGLRKHRELQRAKIDLKASANDLQVSRYELEEEVISAFLEVLCAKESIIEAIRIEEQLRVQEEKTNYKVDLGRSTELDLLQIKAQLYDAANDVHEAEAEYDIARLQLCRLIGVDDYNSLEVSELEPDMSLNPESRRPVSEIVDTRPEIKSAELAVELARKDLQIVKSSLSPVISLSAGYGTSYSGARKMVLSDSEGSIRYEPYPFFRQYADNASSYVSATLSIPIFSGSSTRLAVKQQRIALKDAELALDAARRDMENEVIQAEINAEAAYRQYLGAQEQSDYAEAVMKNISEQYEAGTVDVIAYSTAVTELIRARSQFLTAKYQYLLKLEILQLYV